jgi:hypothetical protein
MSTDQLNFSELARGLEAGAEAAADLWPRILVAHTQRRRRRLRVRVASVLLAGMTGTAVLFMLPPSVPGTDWQARAQALEIELRAYPTDMVDADAREARSGLQRIDSALQAAYDRGAHANELGPLWKERSELLSTLLAVRQQSAAITRI